MSTVPERDESRWGRLRDAVAWRIATFALERIATPWYRGMIEGSIHLGLEAAANTKAEAPVVDPTWAAERLKGQANGGS